MKKLKPEIDVTALQIECEEYKVKCSSLEFKLAAETDKANTLFNEVRRLKSDSEVSRLEIENKNLKSDVEDLKKKCRDLEFASANDTTKIELQTSVEQLNAIVKIKDSENEHLKKLLDTYRQMPDVENMIKHLSELAVPSIKELEDFANAINGSKIDELQQALTRTQEIIESNMRRMQYDRYSTDWRC